MQCIVRRRLTSFPVFDIQASRVTSVSTWCSPARSFLLASSRQFLRRPLLRGPGIRSLSTLANHNATIYALSTATGRAAIAIVRCSGLACRDIYEALCPGKLFPKPRQATLRTLYDPSRTGEILDAGALVLFFQGPNTVTGEDVLEFHVHGGPATVRAVLAGIDSVPSAGPLAQSSTPNSSSSPVELAPRWQHIRYAEPGEFTRRAFANARLSLPQIEALGATLAAETETQRHLAVSTSGSALSERYESWRRALVAARGELEALIDFSEDQHIDDSPRVWIARVAAQVAELKQRILRNAENAARGELLRGGVGVALIGPPNAGKSSLLNAVAGRDAAIVSSEAGTTRDMLDVSIDVDGYECRFADLAGLRSAREGQALGEVETEGMRRAKARALNAPVVVVLLPVVRAESGVDETAEGPEWTLDCNDEVLDTVARLDVSRQTVLLAVNKVDLLPGDAGNLGDSAVRVALPRLLSHLPVSMISCRTDHASGIQPLLRAIAERCKDLTSPAAACADSAPASADEDLLSLGASERQRLLLVECAAYLDTFLTRTAPAGRPLAAMEQSSDDVYSASAETDGEEIDVVLAAEDLRAASDCLGRVAGRGEAGDVEEVLGVVFEKFCVGK